MDKLSNQNTNDAVGGKDFHIFGNGISFSISPTIHNAGFAHYGLPYKYDIRESETIDESADLIRAKTFGGGSVTMPHKLQVHKFCQRQTESAQLIGAINTLIISDDGTITGDNTDWSGLHALIRDQNKETKIAPKAGLVVGAGGAARAALYAMHQANIKSIYVFNRTKTNAERVRDDFAPIFPITVLESLELLPEPIDVIIATIPAHITTQATWDPLLHHVSKAGLCVEMSYKPSYTPLMAAAAKWSGWRVLNGLDVLLAQAFDQFRLWTGLEPPKEIMIEAVRQRSD